MSDFIPYGRQDITQADIDAVTRVLKSDFLTQGPAVPRFENAVADYCCAAHAVATNSATSALHLACLSLGLGPGDWLWTSPITFVASANCALYCGAEIDFVDIDPASLNISPQNLETKLIEAEKAGRLPKIVVPVHFGGQPCDMESIHALSKRFGFRIIEDASHAIGGRYRGEPVGNCRFSDITIFSFHPVKIVTTGEGGMLLTNKYVLARRAALLRSHGITRDPKEMTHAPEGSWYYQQIALGFNYRMTDLQAALGLEQFGRLDEYVARRRHLAMRYDGALKNLPLATPYRQACSDSAWHLYTIRLRTEVIRRTHSEVFDFLRERGIGVNLHYIPVHLQPWYRDRGFLTGDFPEAERYYAQAITLPLFPTMTQDQQDAVVACIKEALE